MTLDPVKFIADLERQRQERAKLRAVRRRARPTGKTSDIPPISEISTEDFCEHWCTWRHIRTRKPIRGLSPAFSSYLPNRTAFRVTPEGQRVGGWDDIAKARRMFITSGSLDLSFDALLRFEGLRAGTFLQSSKTNLVKPLKRDVAAMLQGLPVEWTGGWDKRGGIREVGGEFIFEKTGCIWTVDTAGASEGQADKQGRSSQFDILHGSEVGFWDFPDALISAAVETGDPNSMWVLLESTFPSDREHWWAKEFFLTKEGQGNALKAFFYPWFIHPLKRIDEGSPKYVRVMSPEFRKTIPEPELEREQALGLDLEQIAYRRNAFFTGSPEDRRKARRENPEDEAMAFAAEGEPYFDDEALQAVEAMTYPAPEKYRTIPQLLTAIWSTQYAGPFALGVDVAEKNGVDLSAVVAVDAESGDQVAEIHGRARPDELGQAIVTLLGKLGCKSWRDYSVCVENNKGKAHIDWLQENGVNLWKNSSVSGPHGIGFNTQGSTRHFITDALAGAIEGSEIGDDGEPRKRGPTCAIRSAFLARELCNLEMKPNGKVEAARGHDDLADAAALAWFIAPSLRPIQWSGLRQKMGGRRASDWGPRGAERGGGLG